MQQKKKKETQNIIKYIIVFCLFVVLSYCNYISIGKGRMDGKGFLFCKPGIVACWGKEAGGACYIVGIFFIFFLKKKKSSEIYVCEVVCPVFECSMYQLKKMFNQWGCTDLL